MNNNQFYVYNTHLNQQINIGDAIKITSYPQTESFWVSIEKIFNYNNTILYECKVQNVLNRQHAYNCSDIIYINDNKYIKEYKVKAQRNLITRNEQSIINEKCFEFILEHNRLPTVIEFEQFINLK
jgi:hypothetical protein